MRFFAQRIVRLAFLAGLSCLVPILAIGAARAAPRYYEVELQVQVNGSEIASPSNIAVSDSPVNITMKSAGDTYRLRYSLGNVLVGPNGEHGVELGMQFYKRNGNNWISVGKPRLGLVLGKTGSVTKRINSSDYDPWSYGITAKATQLSKSDVKTMFHGHIPNVKACQNTTSGHGVASASVSNNSPEAGIQPLGDCCEVPCPGKPAGWTLKCCGALLCCDCGTCCAPP